MSRSDLGLERLADRIRARRGISAVEAALVSPVIIMAAGIGYDLTQYTLAQMRVRETAFRMADMAAADRGVVDFGTLSNPNEMYKAAWQMMRPYNICGVSSFILSGVTNADGRGATIAWQQKWDYVFVPPPVGRCDQGHLNTSLVAGLGAIATAPQFRNVLPNQLTVPLTVSAQDSVIVAEVVFTNPYLLFPQIFGTMLPATHIAGAAARVRNVEDATPREISAPPPPSSTGTPAAVRPASFSAW